MHASSRENMHLCAERYLTPEYLDERDEVFVLDVGGADVNGSYGELFRPPRYRYVGADLVDGEGVGLVLEDPYRIPLEDGSVDVVISGQTLEHAEFFWLTFQEMVRVMASDGFLFLIAPSAGPIHRYPVDCYRFYPDAYDALARYADCHLADVWLDERGPWRDLVGVFTKTERVLGPKSEGKSLAPSVPLGPFPDAPPEAEIVVGGFDSKEVLALIHEVVDPDLYLEIGVRHGASLTLAKKRAIGVDPNPELEVELGPDVVVVEQTSDAFFREGIAAELIDQAPDLALIDGLHLFEYALRDFMNVERAAAPTTLVVIDDISPNHALQAARDRETRVWTGDVWKLHLCLAEMRPDLLLLPVDARPGGLLLVAGLDPDNQRLWDMYNPAVRRFIEWTDPPPTEVLERAGAVAGDGPELFGLLGLVRDLRAEGADLAAVRSALRPLRQSLGNA